MTMTMTDNLRRALRLHWVSPAFAFTEFGCLSLAQRVSNLRAEGVQVIDRWEKGENGKRWKAYRIVQA